MNESSVVVILLAVALSGVLLWLLIPRRKPLRMASSSWPPDGNEALPTAKHYVYFRQIRQALSAADSQYLGETAPPEVAKRALRERRAVARRFLQGLHEDFSNLAKLGRIIAVFSPEVNRKQETERLILSVKFEILYGLVWLRLSIGNLPLEQLERLSGIIGTLVTRMDEAMAGISALSVGQLRRGLGA